jgi:hypothetical protein
MMAVNTSYNKQPSASTIYASVTRNEGCALTNGMGVRMPIHAMTTRISEMIKTNDFGVCKDILTPDLVCGFSYPETEKRPA